jgi:hypothetical protein
MTAPEPRENLHRDLQFPWGALVGERLAQPAIQIALGPSNEPLVLFEQGTQPGMVVRPEEMRDYEGPRDAIAEQTIG